MRRFGAPVREGAVGDNGSEFQCDEAHTGFESEKVGRIEKAQ